jgi:hypothetical protein
MKRLILLLLLYLSAPAFAQQDTMNGILNATQYAGGDVGAQINEAFAKCGSKANCTVVLPAGRTFEYSTPIEIPGGLSSPATISPKLDLQGATLTFTGKGDAIVVHGANAEGPAITGGIYNGTIRSATPHSKSVTSLIHIKGRLGFTLSRLHLVNAQYCLDWENRNDDGGPGYSEDNNFEHIESGGCIDHIHAHAGPGATGSYEYNRIDDWHFTLENTLSEEHGLALVGGTTSIGIQGSFLSLKTNIGGNGGKTPVALIYLSNGSSIIRSSVSLHGENTGHIPVAYSVDVEDSGTFYNTGDAFVDMTTVHVATIRGQYVLHPPFSAIVSDLEPTGSVAIHVEAESGAIPQRRCKFDTSTAAVRYWLTSYGGQEANCEFQILARNTDDANPDVYRKGTGQPPANILWTNSVTKSIAVGPGYGPTATGGAQPTHTLEYNGTFGNKTGTFGVDNSGNVSAPNMTIRTSITTSASTSDSVTLTGMTSNGHCAAPGPTNSSAASNVTGTYISAKRANSITLNHPPTAGMTFDILCTPN